MKYADIDEAIKDLEARAILTKKFFRRINRNGDCLYWSSTLPHRYPYLIFRGEVYGVHRLSHALFKGPLNGLLVMHSCDTPACVNPNHLSIGTDADNHLDRIKKRRGTYGTRVNTAKLNDEKVLQIRADNRRYAEIAADYGVTDGLISQIKAGHIWKHLLKDRTFP